MQINDSKILRLILTDNNEAGFKLLVESYQERLYWHIRRMVTFHDDANDVLQDTFIKAYKGIHGFKQESGLYTWLYRIATNESLSFLKKNKKHMHKTEINDLVALEEKLTADSHFDEQAIYLELQKAVSLLPDKQKAVFNLRYFDEMPYKEMSCVLDTSEGALKASYHHAVNKIESYLRKQNLYVG